MLDTGAMSDALYDMLYEIQGRLLEKHVAEQRAAEARCAAKARQPITPAKESLDFLIALTATHTSGEHSPPDTPEEQSEESVPVHGTTKAVTTDTMTTLTLPTNWAPQSLPTPDDETEARSSSLTQPSSHRSAKSQSQFESWRRAMRGERVTPPNS